MPKETRRFSETFAGAPRAIEAVPASVSDALVLDRLGARTEDDLAGPSVEAVRDAKLVAFVLGLHAARLLPVQGGTPIWEIGVEADPRLLAERLGLEVSRVEAAIQRLAKAAVVTPQADGTVRFSEAVCAPRGGSDDIPWPEVLTRLHGQLSAIVVCRAIARHKERSGHPVFEWTPVPDSVLQKLTGFSGSTVRRVRGRLREAQVLEEQRVEGGPSVYRFPRMLHPAGRRGEREVVEPALPPAAPALPGPPPSRAAVPRTFVVPEGVSIEAFGSPLALPPGFEVEIGDGIDAVRVEKDASGRDVLRLGPLSIRRL